MFRKHCSLLLLTLSLLLSLLPSCGGRGGEKPPVKIGALHDWTGSEAIPSAFYADRTIKLVEKQVKDMGGILGGREVKFNKYDGSSTVSGILTAANKAFFGDKMPVLVWGGSSSVNGEVLSDFANENKILFIDPSILPVDISNLKFTLRGGLRSDELDILAEYAVKALKATKVAILCTDLAESHQFASRWEQIVKTAGGNIVYEDFAATDTTDFTPYLTRIKYYNPDVLLTNLDFAGYAVMVQQVTGIGGLGSIKVLASMAATWQAGKPAAEGWYVYARWMPGLDNPSSQKLEQDYRAMFGSEPDGTTEMMYDMLWLAIKAIELAGTATDRAAIATAARSGNLSLDTPLGHVNWGTDGEPEQKLGLIAHIEQGKLIPVQVPE
jgi:branched-chain amino acid transport system substrate-binding protein